MKLERLSALTPQIGDEEAGVCDSQFGCSSTGLGCRV